MEVKDKYRVIVTNRYNAIAKIQSIDEQWEMLRDSIHQTRIEITPKKKETAKNKWMTEEILQLMEMRRLNNKYKDEYNKINKEIRQKCKQAKEIWFNEKFRHIESQSDKDSKSMHNSIKELTGKEKKLRFDA
jgi:hypothetical protein